MTDLTPGGLAEWCEDRLRQIGGAYMKDTVARLQALAVLARAVENATGDAEKIADHIARLSDRSFYAETKRIIAAERLKAEERGKTMQAALEKIRDGREKRMPDGTTQMVDWNDPAGIAHDALSAADLSP